MKKQKDYRFAEPGKGTERTLWNGHFELPPILCLGDAVGAEPDNENHSFHRSGLAHLLVSRVRFVILYDRIA